MSRRIACLLILWSISTGVLCRTIPEYSQKSLNNESVISANWMQVSPEYRALIYQGFNIASDHLPEKLALVPKGKKPAIIVDIDDTLVEGTPYFSSLVGTHDKLSINRSRLWWQDHNEQQQALPGAVEFINEAANQGVEIFYLSGRFSDTLPFTIKTLNRLGFPFADSQHIFLQNPAEKMLSKVNRREAIRKQGFEILLIIGDQLEDMTDPPGSLYSQRQAWVDKQSQRFANDWIVLPNPLYGGWEASLSDNYRNLPPSEKHKIRLEKLNTSLETAKDPILRQHMMQAAIWQFYSGTFRALSYQAYNQAGWQLKKLSKSIRDTIPAVVLDIDGTVLNICIDINLQNIKCSAKDIEKKLLRDDYPLMQGAKSFLEQAQSLGYEIFYVTNRPSSSTNKKNTGDIEQATLANLSRYNLPNVDSRHLLCKESYCPIKNKPCLKEVKRQAIEQGKTNGKKHQIVMMIGDRLDDFDLTEQQLDPDVADAADAVKSQFGRRYILIPNLLSSPTLRDHHRKAAKTENLNSLSQEELANIRIKQLKPWPNAAENSVSEGISGHIQ